MHGSHRTEFRVIGVDLAANAEDTAYCEIVVNPESGTAEIEIGMPKSGKSDASDEALLKAFSQPEVARIGIDAPFGWPDPFVSALRSHVRHNVWPRDRRRKARHFADLTLRATDVHVKDALDGVTPLSVSADRIAVVAMRAALLLSRAPELLEVDRSGVNGHFVEAYPAAALARWGVETNVKRKDAKREGVSYKDRANKEQPQTSKERLMLRGRMVQHLVTALNRTDEVVAALAQTHHAVDAVASALVALMAELDRRLGSKAGRERLTGAIPEEHTALARREGWIVLPNHCSLERLGKELQALKR